MAENDVIAALRSQIATIEAGAGSAEPAPAPSRSRSKRKGPKRAGGASDEERLANPEEALKKIIALVNASERSEQAVRERLAREGFAPDAAEESVQRAKEYGFIDDMRFAEILIRSRLSQGKGSAGIVRELAENGIDADDVPGWPYEYPVSAEDETNRALELLGRKPPHAKYKRDAAYRRLMQKGYPSSIASTAARIWHEQLPE